MSEYEWTKTSISQLIDLFHERQFLWDCANPDYKDRGRKQDAWCEISELLNIPRDLAEKKMRNLTSQFYREYRRFGEAGKRSRWFAYERMMFIKDKRMRGSNPDECEADEEESTTSGKRGASPGAAAGPPAPKRQRRQPHQHRHRQPPPLNSFAHDACASCAISNYLRRRDDAEIIAKSWAIELEKMEETQQLFAKKAINDILLQGRLGNLDQNSVQLNPPEAPTEEAWLETEEQCELPEDSDSEHSIPERKPDPILPGTSHGTI